MDVIDWLLAGDPAIRWQVLRDLVGAPADEVAAERARVERDGWGARLLAVEDPDGLWAGGACFPGDYADGEEAAQPWTATMHTLQTLELLGLDPASESARRAIGLVAENGRWEHAGQRYFDGEVEPCINGRTRRFARRAGAARSTCSTGGCSAARARGTSSSRSTWSSRSRTTGTTTCCAHWTTSGGSGAEPDPRMAEAVAVVESKRQADGRWLLDRIHPGQAHFDLEDADAPSRWNTLRALRVLSWWNAAA